jgi:hypothetical protein
MKEIGITIRLKDKELILTLMEQDIKVNGSKIYNMEKEKKSGLTDQIFLVSIKMERKME